MNTTTTPQLSALVDRWVERGLITREQADAMLADTGAEPLGAAPPARSEEAPAATAPARPTGPSIVVEALGYLGGVIVVIAVGLIVGNIWDSLEVAARIGFAAAVTVVLLAAGLATPATRSDAASRLRAVLWAGSMAALAFALGLFFSDVVEWQDERIAVGTGAVVTLAAAGLWALHRTAVQHAVTFVALVVTAASAAALWLPDDVNGPELAVWGVSLVWGVLAYVGTIRSKDAGLVLGSLGLAFGSMLLVFEGLWTVVSLVSVAAIIALAVLERRMALLGIGAIATFVTLPRAMEYWFPGMLAAALALLVAGLGLVGVAVWIARHHGPPEA